MREVLPLLAGVLAGCSLALDLGDRDFGRPEVSAPVDGGPADGGAGADGSSGPDARLLDASPDATPRPDAAPCVERLRAGRLCRVMNDCCDEELVCEPLAASPESGLCRRTCEVEGTCIDDAAPPLPDAQPVDGPAPMPDATPCPAQEVACTDGADEDCDGLFDCVDPDCTGAACDDGDPCTYDDHCDGGGCHGTPLSCNSDPCMTRACNGTPTCNEQPAGAAQACHADDNPCTGDHCDGAGHCVATPIGDGTSCGGGRRKCCGGACRNLEGDANHCGGCGIDCGNYDCVQLPNTDSWGCRCVGNAECRANGPDWTCYQGYCNCQSNQDCREDLGQSCAIVSGHNYCVD